MKQLISTFAALLFLLISSTSIGQTKTCDTVYPFPEKSAAYQNGRIALLKYVQDELFPIILADSAMRDEFITHLTLIFTIDIHGNAIGINIKPENLTRTCEELLRKKILQMPPWTPATMNDLPVCSEFYFSISCIKYN